MEGSALTGRNAWLIALTSMFVLTLSLADLAATKFVLIGDVVAPGGVFLFAIIFVVRDMIHKLAGASVVKQTIWIAAALNVFVAFYFWFVTRLPSPEFRPAGDWDTIFALAPAIVIASIVAAVVSQLANTAVYDRLWAARRPQWVRVVGSNAVSLPIDSILFTVIGFVVLAPVFGGAPIDAASAVARVASGQTLIKAAIMLAMTPLIYLVPVNASVAPRARKGA